jgi:predicted permease
MTNLLNDIKFSFRQLRKSPVFATVAIVSLALGIGANTTVFSALNGVLLRSLPVRNPHELRLINWIGHNPKYSGYNGPGTSKTPNGFTIGTSFSYPAYCSLRDGGDGLFTDIFAFSGFKSVTVIRHGAPSADIAILVSGNYFSGYGADTLIGRPIMPEDDRPDAVPVAVITYRWWEHHCESNPNVIGQTVTINDNSFTIIGILPRHYMGPTAGDPVDIYLPLSAQPQVWPRRTLTSPDYWWVQIMGRLAPGVKESQAQASLSVIFRQALDLSKTKMGQGGIQLEKGNSGQLMLRRHLAKPFFILAAVAGMVLLIACVNMAGLLLVRGATRQHEMSIRTAVGAGRWQLIRQSLVESLVLSLLGTGFGLIVAVWSRHMMLGFMPRIFLDGSRFDLRINSNVLVFTLGVCVLTTLLFGILPAFRISRVVSLTGLKNRSTLSAPRQRLGKVLIIVQVGLTMLLVVSAGLMIRTFTNLVRVAPGFNAENVLLFKIKPSDAGYNDQQCIDIYEQIRTAVTAIPGVRGVTFSSFPLVCGSSSSDDIEFQNGAKRSGQKWNTCLLKIGDDFLHIMNIPIFIGRDFTSADTAVSPRVAIVNETFARCHFPDENPIGKTFTLQYRTPGKVEIIGVARDVLYKRVRDEIPPQIYLSFHQYTGGSASFAVRSVLPPLSLTPAIRKTVADIASDLPLYSITTQKELLKESVAPDKLFASLSSVLALLAILLSCIGLYGLMAYNVTRRTTEIGIRMALGATPANVARPILREALLLTAIGLAIGIPVSLALTRFIKSQLYGVAPTNPATLIGAGILLIAVTIISAWIPARRAAKINPMEALRCE